MDLEEKLRILGAAARFDVTCSTRGGRRLRFADQAESAALPGVYYTWSEDGRCLPLLKVLLSNRCVYDCAYCVNRASARRPRASFTPEEVADVTMAYYRRRLVRGLFLSSGVWVSPDHTMEKLLLTARKLREERGFRGYIHLKVIPGASADPFRDGGLYADRLSVNIELPTPESLRLIAPDKRPEDILVPMGEISRNLAARREEGKAKSCAPPYLPAGQTTQLIVGATPEDDLQIMGLAERLYRDYGLRRIYYSAFIPVTEDPRLPPVEEPPLLREHRLYQADWLIRRYGFRVGELLEESRPFLEEELDPKSAWALRNLHYFPVEVNTADYEELIRVPGIGLRSARRIVALRRQHSLDFQSLARIGVAVRRARYFITCNGRYCFGARFEERTIREHISSAFRSGAEGNPRRGQLSLLDWGVDEVRKRSRSGELLPDEEGRAPRLPTPEDALITACGEI